MKMSVKLFDFNERTKFVNVLLRILGGTLMINSLHISVISADNLCKQFGPRLGLTKRRA